jgi:hypothetical protein
MNTVGHSVCERFSVKPAEIFIEQRVDETVACPKDDGGGREGTLSFSPRSRPRTLRGAHGCVARAARRGRRQRSARRTEGARSGVAACRARLDLSSLGRTDRDRRRGQEPREKPARVRPGKAGPEGVRHAIGRTKFGTSSSGCKSRTAR